MMLHLYFEFGILINVAKTGGRLKKSSTMLIEKLF